MTSIQSDLSEVKALVFDVFGTVVDWRTSLIDDFTAWGAKRGIDGDWTALVDAWRGAYVPAMDSVRKQPDKPFVALEDLQRSSVIDLAKQLKITGLTDADIDYLNMGWRRLNPWPDSVSGLTRLKTRYTIAPLSNGNLALLTGMAKHAGLPWDAILGSDLFGHYKPDPENYLGAAALLRLAPAEVMMVAAHNGDLQAAQALGFKTAFIPRVTEYGPHQVRDFGPEGIWDMVAQDMNDLADRLGCA